MGCGTKCQREAASIQGWDNVCMFRVLVWFLKLCFTFPQAFDPLFPGDGPVGLQGAVVPLHWAAVRQTNLSLEPDFDHVGGLGKGHGHGSRGAARQQPGPDADICSRDDRRWTSSGGLTAAGRAAPFKRSDGSEIQTLVGRSRNLNFALQPEAVAKYKQVGDNEPLCTSITRAKPQLNWWLQFFQRVRLKNISSNRVAVIWPEWLMLRKWCCYSVDILQLFFGQPFFFMLYLGYTSFVFAFSFITFL